MIITDNLNIKINSTSLKHYLSKGYNVKVNDVINIITEDLPKNSMYKIQVKCDICGNEKELSYNKYLKNFEKYKIYCCSNKCSYFKNKKTKLEKYGDENFSNKEKYKQTCLERYGVDNIFERKEIKEKIKNNNLKKYGFESPNSSEIVKENKKKSFLNKYGVDNYFKTEEYKNKMLNQKNEINNKRTKTYKNTCESIYGVSHTSKLEKIRKNIKETNQKTYLLKIKKLYENKNIIIKDIDFENKQYIIECKKCNTNFNIEYSLLKNRIKYKTEICTNCNPISKHISGLEIQLKNFIQNNVKNVIFNCKSVIPPFELDVYLPDFKLGFEFNGLFWHCELNRDKNYHLNKTKMCEKQDIQLIHIFEDDWKNKQEIVKFLILNKLNILLGNKILPENAEVKEITDSKLVKNFLLKNYIYEYEISDIAIGLFFENELISLMTFNTQKFNKYELKNYCNKISTNIDSFDKMLNYFINKYQPKEILALVNKMFEQGELYCNFGFKFIDETKPNCYLIINDIKYKLTNKIKLENNIYRIYDSGNLKFKYVSRK